MKISNVIVRLCEEFISLPNSLGITRDKMPQIPADKLEAFLKYLKTDAGCDYERISLPASQLTPSQNELDTDKADKIWNDGNAFDHVIIISADKYILDGHHRWFAVKRNAPEEKMNCIMLSYNAKPCLEIMLNFDQVEKENLKGEIVEGYFTVEDSMSISQIESQWRNGDKGYDARKTLPNGSYYHGMWPTEEIWKYREYTRPLNPSLLDSIKKHGIQNPIDLTIVKKGKSYVGEGNHRLTAAKKLGIKEVPVVFSFYQEGKPDNFQPKTTQPEQSANWDTKYDSKGRRVLESTDSKKLEDSFEAVEIAYANYRKAAEEGYDDLSKFKRASTRAVNKMYEIGNKLGLSDDETYKKSVEYSRKRNLPK